MTFLILVLILGVRYILTYTKSLPDNSISPRQGIITTKFPTEFIEGKTEVITIEARYIDKYALNEELEVNEEIDTIPLGSQMKIEIIDLSPSESLNFEISEIGENSQIIGNDIIPVWEFKITPLKSGEMSIGIKPTIGITKNPIGELEMFDLKMIKKDLDVKASFGYRIKKFIYSHWQWLMTVLIIPIWIYLRSRILRALKKKKKTNPIGFK